VIPAETTLQSTSGVTYLVDEDASVGGDGTVEIAVTAQLAGRAGNALPDAVLTFISPLVGVAAVAAAGEAGITGGADLESDDSLRDRMLRRIQNPPHGGTQADYELWALEVPSITRAWCFPLYEGPGTVRVYVANDNAASETHLADPGDVSAADAHMQAKRPIGVAKVVEEEVVSGLEVVAPELQPVDFTIALVPNDADVQAAVISALKEAFYRDARPEGAMLISREREAVSLAIGEQDHTITVPTGNQTADAGKILVLGEVTFT
jgi:uncharacterized phage protein gp47/JayE